MERFDKGRSMCNIKMSILKGVLNEKIIVKTERLVDCRKGIYDKKVEAWKEEKKLA